MNLRLGTLLILLMSSVFITNAQVTDRGNFIIGGTLGFSSATSDVEQSINGQSTTLDGATGTQLNISPSIGYFLVDNFALGVGMDYTFNKVEEPDGTEENDNDLLFGPFIRYYFPVGNNMSFFLESTAGFGSSSNTSDFGGQTQDISTNVFAFGIGPGFTIFSSNAIGIEALVKYNYASSDADFDVSGETANVITTTNQFDFSVGLQFYFSRLGLSRANP